MSQGQEWAVLEAVTAVLAECDGLGCTPGDKGAECACGETITTDPEIYPVDVWNLHVAGGVVAAVREVDGAAHDPIARTMSQSAEAAVAALRDAADWLHDLPWEPGQANRGPADSPEDWMRGASDGVEWAVDRIVERAARIESEWSPTA